MWNLDLSTWLNKKLPKWTWKDHRAIGKIEEEATATEGNETQILLRNGDINPCQNNIAELMSRVQAR